MDRVQNLLGLDGGTSNSGAVSASYERRGRVAQLCNVVDRYVAGDVVDGRYDVFVKDGFFAWSQARVYFPPNVIGGVPRFNLTRQVVALLYRFVVQVRLCERIIADVGRFSRRKGVVTGALVVAFSCREAFVFFCRLTRVFTNLDSVDGGELVT